MSIMAELSIIMPCYKGEKFIKQSIREVEKVVNKFCNSFEIIVVVDEFIDKTYEIAKRLEESLSGLNKKPSTQITNNIYICEIKCIDG